MLSIETLTTEQKETFDALIKGLKGNEQRFYEYAKKNPHIGDAFERLTLQRIDEGWSIISFREIVERLRWAPNPTSNKHFGIADQYIAYYGRLFISKYPEYKDRFTLTRIID